MLNPLDNSSLAELCKIGRVMRRIMPVGAMYEEWDLKNYCRVKQIDDSIRRRTVLFVPSLV